MAAVLLLTLLLFQNTQELPPQYYELPEEVRAKATLVLRGTFESGRSPCIMRPDGSRVWFRDSWFSVEQIYNGQVTPKGIRINTAMLPKTGRLADLKEGADYLVLLHPDAESQTLLESEGGLSLWQALKGDEIVAIVKLKQ